MFAEGLPPIAFGWLDAPRNSNGRDVLVMEKSGLALAKSSRKQAEIGGLILYQNLADLTVQEGSKDSVSISKGPPDSVSLSHVRL